MKLIAPLLLSLAGCDAFESRSYFSSLTARSLKSSKSSSSSSSKRGRSPKSKSTKSFEFAQEAINEIWDFALNNRTLNSTSAVVGEIRDTAFHYGVTPYFAGNSEDYEEISLNIDYAAPYVAAILEGDDCPPSPYPCTLEGLCLITAESSIRVTQPNSGFPIDDAPCFYQMAELFAAEFADPVSQCASNSCFGGQVDDEPTNECYSFQVTTALFAGYLNLEDELLTCATLEGSVIKYFDNYLNLM